jgi:beta-lactamase class A
MLRRGCFRRPSAANWIYSKPFSSGVDARQCHLEHVGTGDYGSTNDIGIAYGPDGQRVLLWLTGQG